MTEEWMPQPPGDDDDRPIPPIVVMGVSAAGKSSVARGLAAQLVSTYIDADDLHPEVNVAKMAAGMALDDGDRWAWLDDVGRALAHRRVVVACSALARRYRDRIRSHAPDAAFVHLHGSRDLLHTRARGREGHFMPPELLESQFAALEMLESDETGIVLDVDASVEELVERARSYVERIRSGED